MHRIKIAFLAIGLLTSGYLIAMDTAERKINKIKNDINNYFKLLPDMRAQHEEAYQAIMNNEFHPSERLGHLKQLLDKIERGGGEGAPVEDVSEDSSALENTVLDNKHDTQDQKPIQRAIGLPYLNFTIIGGIVALVAIGAGVYAYRKKIEHKSQTRKPGRDETQDAIIV